MHDDCFAVLSKVYFKVIYIYMMGAQPFDGKVPHPLSWAGSRVTLGKIIINGIPK